MVQADRRGAVRRRAWPAATTSSCAPTCQSACRVSPRAVGANGFGIGVDGRFVACEGFAGASKRRRFPSNRPRSRRSGRAQANAPENKENRKMTTRVAVGGPPTDVYPTTTAPRVTPEPARPFQQVMNASSAAIVSGAEAAVTHLPGGSILAAAMRPGGSGHRARPVRRQARTVPAPHSIAPRGRPAPPPPRSAAV